MKKKLGVMAICFMLLISTGVVMAQKKGVDRNSNRYGSMELVDGELYYYANHYIYKYVSGNSEKIEKADSCIFTVEKKEGNVEIVYKEEGSAIETNPYTELLDGANHIVHNAEYLYAKYPAANGSICVYKIKDQKISAEALEKIDEIVF